MIKVIINDGKTKREIECDRLLYMAKRDDGGNSMIETMNMPIEELSLSICSLNAALIKQILNLENKSIDK